MFYALVRSAAPKGKLIKGARRDLHVRSCQCLRNLRRLRLDSWALSLEGHVDILGIDLLSIGMNRLV